MNNVTCKLLCLSGPCHCAFKVNCLPARQQFQHGRKKDVNKGCIYYWMHLRRVDGVKRGE